jgi:hypothetical protein
MRTVVTVTVAGRPLDAVLAWLLLFPSFCFASEELLRLVATSRVDPVTAVAFEIYAAVMVIAVPALGSRTA